MARFLSPEWLSEVEDAAVRDERVRRTASMVDLTVHHVVRGGPQGDVAYTVHIADGTVQVRPGGTDGDVELTQDYGTAVAISQGTITPASAFAAGRLKLGGRVDVLVRNGDALSALTDAFARVRETTEY
ncbi:MAG TPA: SCP2 sterol-binding domain-containing protein [Acidimicrobiales bacterium]|nr:SCP2 sterol-binding domain-containing protein [Acidimicrobiales bacterium]